MSNLNPQQFHQLPLLMTTEELGNLPSGDWSGMPMRKVAKMYNDPKGYLTEAEYERGKQERYTGDYFHAHSIRRSIQQHGGYDERYPVQLTHDDEGEMEFTEGHHRFAAASKSGIDLIPVTHHFDYQSHEDEYNRQQKHDEDDLRARGLIK